MGDELRAARAELTRVSHWDDRCRQFGGDRLQHAFGIRPAAVDLVHEDERRNAQALHRPHQHARLRLHALDSRDHEHRAVEHVQHALDLGDEVGVAGRVDQVDRDVVDDERNYRGLDRDAALPFEREGIGLSTAFVDASDLADDTGDVQEPLGEGCLTSVYMRQNPKVQGSH